jgi:glycosyltransferase involved in cell wall biosynthesis
MRARRRILLIYRYRSGFTDIDRDLLRRRWDVTEWTEAPSRRNLRRLVALVRGSDLVFGWFATAHSVLPLTLAWLMRKPTLLVIGGVDVANMPEIGYGAQRGGPRKWIARWGIARATRLVTNSYFSLGEIQRNLGLGPERVTVVHHGIPDPFGQLGDAPRDRMALTVGIVDRRNLERKGIRAFVEAARELPDVEFVVAGRWDGDAGEQLRSLATPNVTLTGWVEQGRLQELYRRASVYVQASRHEGFGMSVAEGMLAGCVPVVTRAGALPEVVGGEGVQIGEPDPHAVARGVARAIKLGGDARRRARERIRSNFPLERREEGLAAVVGQLLDGPG